MKIPPSPRLSSSFPKFFFYLLFYGNLVRDTRSESRFMLVITLPTLHCSSGSGKRKVEEKTGETGVEVRNPKAPQTLKNSCQLETSMARILCIREYKWTFWKGRHIKGSYFYFNINGLDTLGLIAIFK